MERTPPPEEHVIHLSQTSADDGDWTEVAPETVLALTSYLKTNQFLVLTSEENPMELISMVTDAMTSDRTEEADGYTLELGHFHGIPAVELSDDVIAVYFAATDEDRLRKRLKWPELPTFISLPESPPLAVGNTLGLFEVRMWVPMGDRESLPASRQESFGNFRPIFRNDKEALYVPGEFEEDLFERLDAYFERMAIVTHSGGIPLISALSVAMNQILQGGPLKKTGGYSE